MQHLDEGTIHSWLDGALSAEEAARVSAHIEECPQCAAAVAEARGFIAASSRILTALDNVPKGVVPVGVRPTPRNWAAWRAAAAVLVVAVGSFAVLRERMTSRPSAAEVIAFTARPTEAPAGADRAMIDTGLPVSLPPTRAPVAPTTQTPTTQAPTRPAAPTRNANPLGFGRIENQETRGREGVSASAAASQPAGSVAGVPLERRADNATLQSATAPAMKVAAEPLSGHVAAAAISARAGGVAMSDAAAGPASIRVVGTPRVIGENRTLYEVAPGDTVLLAETMRMELSAVVVTGIGTATTRIAQSADTASGRRIQLRGASSSPVASDSQRSNAAPKSAAVPPANLPAPPPAVETLNGITTLTWTDPASGNTMKLSGRHSAAELTEIRRKIEQLRAVEAAKKKP
jgi:putative zinc finger protein